MNDPSTAWIYKCIIFNWIEPGSMPHQLQVSGRMNFSTFFSFLIHIWTCRRTKELYLIFFIKCKDIQPLIYNLSCLQRTLYSKISKLYAMLHLPLCSMPPYPARFNNIGPYNLHLWVQTTFKSFWFYSVAYNPWCNWCTHQIHWVLQMIIAFDLCSGQALIVESCQSCKRH